MTKEKTKAVNYHPKALVITLHTTSPKETHHLLMQGLTTCLRQNITSDDKRNGDADGLVAVAELLQTLLPEA